MGNIFRVVETQNIHEVVDIVKYISTSREFHKEMGEPLIVELGQTWSFCYIGEKMVGFSSYVKYRILYFYTLPEYRCHGVFNALYDNLPQKQWQVVASNASYPIFLKKGFEVIKNYVNCHRLIKKI